MTTLKIRTTRTFYNIPDGLAETCFVKVHIFYIGGFNRNEMEQNFILTDLHGFGRI